MKALFIGIFAIIAIGLLYFTVQVVKSPQFKTSLVPNPTTFGGDDENVGGDKGNVFVDINNGFSFALPEAWKSISPEKVPGFAPLIQAGPGKYLTVSTKLFSRKENINADIESLTTKLPQAMIDTVSVLAGEEIDIRTETVKKLTFKNGINGFKISYQGQTKEDVLVPQYVKGNMYAYYVRGDILYAYTVHISSEKSELEQASGSQATSFLQEGDTVLQEMTIF
jgi:hypothetical protein